MMGYDWSGAMGGLGWLGMGLGLVFWVALIVLLVWGATALFGPRGTTSETDALEILRRRYAGGEITQAEYEQARRALA